MIITRTPYRISFLGGGSDFPVWYQDHIGMVLGTSIDKYCYLTIKYNPQFTKSKYKLSYSVIEECDKVEDIQHPAIRETLRYLIAEGLGGLADGLELYHTGDLPARSGVGSSSAFVVGLLNALLEYDWDVFADIDDCAEIAAYLATHIEHDILKEDVGSQDQLLCSLGGLNQIVWHPSGERAIRPIELSPERLQEFQSHLMLFYTGPRNLPDPNNPPRIYDNTKDLQDIAHSVQTGIMILTSDMDIRLFGEVLDDAWDLKKRLSSGISTERVDTLYKIARREGVIGGKLLGSGGGGFVLLLCEPEKQEAVERAMDVWCCKRVRFQFETEGSKVIYAS